MTRRAGVILLSVALLATAPDAAQASRCAAVKARATAMRMQRGGRCRAVGVRNDAPPKPACLTKATARLARAFDRAGRFDDCPTEVTATTVDLTVAGFLANVEAALPHLGTRASRRCSAAKLVATARRGAATLRCVAATVHSGMPVSPGCVEKTTERFDRMIARAERRWVCADTPSSTLLAGAADALVAAVVSALDPSSSPTTSSTSTSTTMTTSTTKPGGSTTTMPIPTSSISATTSTSSTTSTASSSTITTTSSTTSTSAPGAVSFANDIQPIFTTTCAVAGCHSAPVPAQGLDLRAGRAHVHLVGVTSEECPLFPRVAPGLPGGSYLVFKLGGPPQPCFSGNQMPAGGRAPLSDEQQAMIAAWIGSGAPDN